MWGESGASGFFEDVHVLIVVVLGMSILLGSLAAAWAARETAAEAAAFRSEAGRVLRALAEDPSILHAGRLGLLDLSAIEHLNSTGLVHIARPAGAAQLLISEESGDARRTFQVETEPLGTERATASTATAVWHSDLDVRTARITVTVGR